MNGSSIERRRTQLSQDVAETGRRIRRYSLDPRLRTTRAPAPSTATEGPRSGDQAAPEPQPSISWATIRQMTDDAWSRWLAVRDALLALPDPAPAEQLAAVEKQWLEIDRDVDLIQRELIAESSAVAGAWTVAWLATALVGLSIVYLVTHGVRGPTTAAFESWPEWGPEKYGEVAFWSSFGVLCWLLFTASNYLARRDFDEAYRLWYVSTALRAPFICVALMVVVLEFVEWYGEGKWIERYILEEGNKFYFIAFVSFCLGLSSDRASTIIRELAGGVAEFFESVARRMSQRLGSAVSSVDLTPK